MEDKEVRPEELDNDGVKFTVIRLLISSILFAGILISDKGGYLSPDSLPLPIGMLYLVPFAIAGFETVVEAFKAILHGEFFGEELLMFIAVVAAFAVGQCAEGVMVILLFELGELLEELAVGKSTRSIEALLDIAPEYANLEDDNMNIKRVEPSQVETGSIIFVKPGERVPIDCIIISGESYIDTGALTGESVPVHVGTGEAIYSGSINKEGVLTCRTVRKYEDSMVSKILKLTSEASEHKSGIENFISQFARFYTPSVIAAAFLLVLIPGLVTGNWAEWITRACSFLVISCPCALVISIPLSFFCGIGTASRLGVLVKGSNYLEAVSRLGTVAFDKTGTLTRGEFSVNDVIAVNAERHDILRIASEVEINSTHPIAQSICRAYSNENGDSCAFEHKAKEVREIAGKGISAILNGKKVLVGNSRLLEENDIEFEALNVYGSVVYIAEDGQYLGAIVVSDGIRQGMKETVASLRRLGVSKTVMVTGDVAETAERVAKEIGIDEYRSNLLPEGKVDVLQEIIGSTSDSKQYVAYLGDGINDAPVLAGADVGIAMGSLGSAAAIEAADIVIMDDDPGKLPKLIGLSRKTMKVVRENVIFAISVKVAVLILASFGITPMWLAVFADVGVSLLCILNSVRIRYYKVGKEEEL